jgi:hypothetical protein
MMKKTCYTTIYFFDFKFPLNLLKANVLEMKHRFKGTPSIVTDCRTHIISRFVLVFVVE